MATKRQLRREITDLEERVAELEKQFDRKLIEREVPDPTYPRGIIAFDYYGNRHMYDQPTKKVHELTIGGKVDTILEHLGIDVQVEQRKTTTTGPKVKVTKQKSKK